MKSIITLVRIIVGALFIFSGLIKLNDPVGFAFKLEEYFSPAVFDLSFLMPMALALAIIIVIVEVLLGLALLLGYKTKLTLWLLLVMIIFFTFLTFYSAYFNKVTDCGCFGDAIPLTPWESFTKDVILLVLILILWRGRKYITPLVPVMKSNIVLAISLVLCFWMAYHVYNHLPLKDFRAYKVGVNIEEGMSIPEDASKAIYEYAWKFDINGEEKVIVTQGEYPDVDGEFIGVETEEVQAGYEPPIHDFTIEQNGNDQASLILKEPKLAMIIAYDLSQGKAAGFSKLPDVTKKAEEAGYKVIGMSASSIEHAAALSAQYKLSFPFYFTDATTLKTIIRSNPGVVLLKNGTIVQKEHFNDIDNLQFD
ncbi:MAG: DoxX family membrane protein [Bacteroidia bacterium]|nr:DoxX family membrane protein [Bacteroidia bacterium]